VKKLRRLASYRLHRGDVQHLFFPPGEQELM
jgi:hypothetical protein